MQLTHLLFTTFAALVSFEGVAASQCQVGNSVKQNCCWGGRGGEPWISALRSFSLARIIHQTDRV